MTSYRARFLIIQPISVSDSLENVLLSMCEEAAQARFPLVQVIKVCVILGQALQSLQVEFLTNLIEYGLIITVLS